MLWVYEGQTQFWGTVLAARAGLWTKQQGLDCHRRRRRDLRRGAAGPGVAAARRHHHRSGLHHAAPDPVAQLAAQRGLLRRRRTHLARCRHADPRENHAGKKSIDDFAHVFFGINDGSYVTVTYTFDDVVHALNTVVPFDWAGFLHARLDAVEPAAPLDGIKRGGYRLVYTDAVESDFLRSNEKGRKITDLTDSLGLTLDSDAAASDVVWDGPAFEGLAITVGAKIVAVNGVAYDSDRLKDAIKDAKTSKAPIQLLLKRGDIYRTVAVDYHGGLRYPHLERVPGTPALLDAILAPR